MDLSKFQGFMSGGQVRYAFAEYNVYAGSDVVDLSRNYNTGDKYCNRIGTGNQIDLAFAEINAELGTDTFDVGNLDWSNGAQLKKQFLKLKLLVDAEGPIWATIPNQVMVQGTAFPIALGDYSFSVAAMTYTKTVGNLPTGITLNPNGTFNGTASNSGRGTLEFTATDENGATASNWFDWDVLSVP